jgi:hypothetical protein
MNLLSNWRFLCSGRWMVAAWVLVALIALPIPLRIFAEESTPPAKKDRSQLLLKYGDDQPDGRKSIGGTGEMIRFALPGETGKVRAVRVHGARYGYPQPPQEDI